VTAPFERLAVLGLGLLGGSLAMAARQRGAARRVVGATRRRDVLERALACGALDEACGYEQAVRGADLVVLATPLAAMPEVVARIAPALAEGALVTDVGSVKGPLAETLPGLLPPGARYLGSHPMAGSHESGFEHARAELFDGSVCIVTADPGAAGVERLAAFWSRLGARIVLREPGAHDEQVAWMSHVPHLLAFAFARALERAPEGSADVAGPGFRDFTRIARGDPGLWADILTANRKSLAAPLQAVAAALADLSRAVEAGDAGATGRSLAAARAALCRASGPLRRATSARRQRPGNPRPDVPAGARSDKEFDE